MAAFWSAALGWLAGLVTAGLVTAYRHQTERRRAREQATIKLYEDFQCSDMIDCRIAADRVLSHNENSAVPLSFMELYKQVSPNEWRSVSHLVHFFERMATVYFANHLDGQLIDGTIRRYYLYYYDRYLRALGERSLERDDADQTNWFERLPRLRASLSQPIRPTRRTFWNST
jgi:hypothetical protein